MVGAGVSRYDKKGKCKKKLWEQGNTGNPKIRNPEFGNQNPESGNQNPKIKQNKVLQLHKS